MEDRIDVRLAVLAHSSAAFAFFLCLAFLPRLLPSLGKSSLTFWICVIGAGVSFVMTNLVHFRLTRRFPQEV